MGTKWARARETARAKLASAGVASPDAEVRLLADFVFGAVPSATDVINDADLAAFERVVAEREARVPLQHIVGTMYFRYLELESLPGVFVVRPETELVAEAAIAEIENMNATPPGAGSRPIVVDLCTGSGAIAIAIATESAAEVTAVELSDVAFESASRNNAACGNKVRLVHGDALTALPELEGRVDVVVSNPPYVRDDEDISPEVAQDPQMALFGGGHEGLDMPVSIIDRARVLLRDGGILIMEHGDGQGAPLRDAANERGFVNVSTGQDLTGRDRWLRAQKGKA